MFSQSSRRYCLVSYDADCLHGYRDTLTPVEQINRDKSLPASIDRSSGIFGPREHTYRFEESTWFKIKTNETESILQSNKRRATGSRNVNTDKITTTQCLSIDNRSRQSSLTTCDRLMQASKPSPTLISMASIATSRALPLNMQARQARIHTALKHEEHSSHRPTTTFLTYLAHLYL
jgi:hypothetical protein